ncbi:MAG: fixH [Rickettsiaceae bacterium]|jgi:nitrogen fixation protein FixH|nr:fixH [Rickettsiaceae bacterium]
MKEPQKKPQNYKAIPWFFAIFFSTFIIVDIIYITIAEKTWRGVYTEDGYQKGLKYNQSIEAVKNQENLGWDLQIKYQPTKNKAGTLQVDLLDKNHERITDAIVTAKIRRPVQEGADFSLPLKFDPATSSYKSAIEFPLIGQWDLEIIAKKNGDIYQQVKRIVVR